MTIEDLINIELPGTLGTIEDYTSDHYILNYISLMRSSVYPKDIGRMIVLISKLRKWYKKEIKQIKNNRFIKNLDAHNKSIDILDMLLTKLIERKEK